MQFVYAICSKETNQVQHWVGDDGKTAGYPMIYATIEHAEKIADGTEDLFVMPVPLLDTIK